MSRTKGSKNKPKGDWEKNHVKGIGYKSWFWFILGFILGMLVGSYAGMRVTKVEALTLTVNEKIEQCVDVEGHWEVNHWIPDTLKCHVHADINGNRDVSAYYSKPTGDDKHCHRINWGDLSNSLQQQFKDWHGYSNNWQSAYNSHLTQNPEAVIDVAGHFSGWEDGYIDSEGDEKRWVETTYKDCEPTPEPTPEVTPEVTPEPTPEVTPEPSQPESKPEGCTQNCGVPACTDSVPEPAVNPHIYRSGDTALVKWYPKQGDKVNIYWRLNTSNNWEHAISNSPNDGYEEINGLGSSDWTFGVQTVNGCASDGIVNASNITQIVDGNTHTWVLFR